MYTLFIFVEKKEMYLSHTCSATFKALLHIATQSASGSKSSLKDIAFQVGENEHTLGKSLQILVKNGHLSSAKGPLGGFFLTPVQLQRPLMAVVQLLDGPQLFTGCLLGLSECSAQNPCPLHDQFVEVRNRMNHIFHENTIADLSAQILAGTAFVQVKRDVDAN